MRTQFTNRVYETKYENETYHFIKSLNPSGTMKETAEIIGVTYKNFQYAFQQNRITYGLRKKIINNLNITDEQKEILNKLVAN